jgi:hypothetical protein
MKVTLGQLVMHSKIKQDVQNVPQIQRNIIGFFTNIVLKKCKNVAVYFAIDQHTGIKKPPGLRAVWLGAGAYLAALAM